MRSLEVENSLDLSEVSQQRLKKILVTGDYKEIEEVAPLEVVPLDLQVVGRVVEVCMDRDHLGVAVACMDLLVVAEEGAECDIRMLYFYCGLYL